ncbi:MULTISPECIES: phosphoglycerate dehydrogenase [Methylococcus]|uniref:D-3-phosphoglycerate dehydrogenase n=1 Tax=Methylococcus capsulatus TaxID=414 RepID=A0ABZ2F4S1_METCP|nr:MULTISPECIES: phosphoglycerate dehydrogenase [Methylococcus]MDF9391645.1 3-phosphoglycerate dehydrogenase [Methylococcus capsulatus]
MYKVLTYDNIAVTGLERLPRDRYEVASEIQHPDAILLRSFDLKGVTIPDSVRCIGRAGAGVNNIPVADCSRRGIPVFNTPGANANAVKEIVVAGMLLAARHICEAWDFTRSLAGDDAALAQAVERNKKNFVGTELAGKTLGVLGLGAVGVGVANAAVSLGMNVTGFDPALTVERAWQLSAAVSRAGSTDDLIAHADFISLHVPLNGETRNMIDAGRLGSVKKGAVLLNFSRAGIVDEVAVRAALEHDRLSAYVSDFPTARLMGVKGTILLPHLGASTVEAEDNCAVMIADQIRDFLENGNIRNSVNYPTVEMPRCHPHRIGVANENIPNMVSQISAALGEAGLNILELLNKSRGEYAYTLIDLDTEVPPAVLDRIANIRGVLSVHPLLAHRP